MATNTNSNDSLTTIFASFNEARKHGEKASNATLRAALQLNEAIYAERFGAVDAQWYSRDMRESGMLASVLKHADCDSDAIAATRKEHRDMPRAAAELVNAKRDLARSLTDALICAAAMETLHARTGLRAEYNSKGIVHVPAHWFFPEDAADYEAQRPAARDAMLTVTVTRGRMLFNYLPKEGYAKVVAARDAGLTIDPVSLEKRGEANVSREGIVRLVQPKPAKRDVAAPGDNGNAKVADVSDDNVAASMNVLTSALARKGGVFSGKLADGMEDIMTQLVASDDTWSLLVALRNAHETAAKAAAAAAAA